MSETLTREPDAIQADEPSLEDVSVPRARKRVRKVAYTGLGNTAGRPVISSPIRDHQSPDRYYSRGFLRLHDDIGTESDNLRLLELANLRDGLREQSVEYITDYLSRAGLDVDLEAIAQRLDITGLTLVDPQDIQQDHLADTKGFFMPSSREATVLLEKDWYGQVGPTVHTVIHELLHSASTVVYASGPKMTEIGFHSTNAHGLKRGKKFEWLNEAVTEKLAQMICADNELAHGSAYYYEVKLLEEITKVSGISFKSFLEAYFEEVDLDAKPGERMPKWHALQQKLASRFGPHFLEKVDKLQGDDNGLKNYGLLKKNEEGRTEIELMFEDWRDHKADE